MNILIVASALLYALAINYTFLFWPLVLIFPIPLFYAALKHHLTFKNGFVWGLIFFGLHLHDIARTIFAMGDGSYLLRIVPAIFIILYMALYPATWFWCTQNFIDFCKVKKISTRVLIWILTLWIYILSIDHYSLWIFNRIEGYPLAQPLLTLAHKPQLLTLLAVIGKSLLTLLLLLIPATLFLLLYTKQAKWFFALLLVCIPWIISPLLFQNITPPEWAKTITYLPVVFPKGTNTPAMINGAVHDIKKILFKKPNTQVIILPESAFYCDDLCMQEHALLAWSEEQVGKKVHIILGAFRQDKNKYYNCLYWIYNGKLKGHCDKHHAMPLVEKLPNWFSWPWLKSIYFAKHNQLNIAHATRPQFMLTNTTVVPYICSELYFNQSPDDQYANTTILLASNDRWFSPAYVPDLLLKVACLKAIEWQRTIIYCSFYHGTFCLPSGELHR